MKKRMVDRQLESMLLFFLGGHDVDRNQGVEISSRNQPRFTWIGFPWFLVTTMGFTLATIHGEVTPFGWSICVCRNSSFNQHKEKT